jgi:hypothetical protein
MRNSLYIFDLGVERYVDILREAEHIRIVKKAKKGNKHSAHILPLIRQLLRTV